MVPRNEQIVRPLDPKHLQSNQYGRDHDRVHTVYANAVHALQPGQCVTLFINVARVRAYLGDRAA
jgi:hypothetical protein